MGFRVRTPPVTSSEGQIPLPQLGYTRDEHLIYTNYEVRGNKINSVCSVFILCRYKLLLVRVDVSWTLENVKCFCPRVVSPMAN